MAAPVGTAVGAAAVVAATSVVVTVVVATEAVVSVGALAQGLAAWDRVALILRPAREGSGPRG